MNKFEQIKADKDGLDVLPEILRYAEQGWETISDDDKTRMKWYGLFFRKHTPGYFMLRVRIPNGIASVAQLRALASIIRDFGRDEIDITTRQQIQVRWFRIEHVPEIFSRLRDVGIEHRQTGMDNIRGVMGCPLAGFAAYELFDASPIARAFSRRLAGDKAFSNLPRKFNVSISGCPDNCVPSASQDLALVPATRETDAGSRLGFNVLVGGKMGSGGFVPARDIDVFVPPEDAEELCTQLVFVFRDNGPREARARARLAFLIDDWGVERFRAELQLRLARPLERAGRDQRHAYETEHIGVTPLRETGRYAIGLAVPVGRLTADQLCGVADLAQEYGDGTARLTPGQNLVLVGVEGSRLAKLFGEPLLRVLRHDPPPSIRATVACTGIGLCDLALTDTKVDALAVARRLEPVIPLAGQRPMSINWSGCPAACASHHGADIGLQGAKVRVGERVIEVYDVSVGGRVGRLPRPARPLLRHVPVEQIAAIVERLALAHTDGADLYEAGPRIVSELEPTLAARVAQTARGD